MVRMPLQSSTCDCLPQPTAWYAQRDLTGCAVANGKLIGADGAKKEQCGQLFRPKSMIQIARFNDTDYLHCDRLVAGTDNALSLYNADSYT